MKRGLSGRRRPKPETSNKVQRKTTQAKIKKDSGQLPVQGSSRRPRRPRQEKDDSYDADVEGVTFDSDDSGELDNEPPNLRGGNRYTGRLRQALATKINLQVLCSLEEQESSDNASEDCEKSEVEVKRQVEPRPNWLTKRRRTKGPSEGDIGPSEKDVTPRKQDFIPSQEGFDQWITYRRKRSVIGKRSAPGRTLAQGKAESLTEEKRPGQPSREVNAFADCRTVGCGSPRSSVSKIGSPGKRNPVRHCNMVTQIDSFPRNLGGLHEVPATPMTPPIRKRKAGLLSDGFPEAHGLDAVNNRRARSDGAERGMEQRSYQLSSDGEQVTKHSSPAVAGSYCQTPPSSVLAFDEFVIGDYSPGDPRLGNLDAMVNGEVYRSSALVNDSQFFSGEEARPILPIDDLDAVYFQGGEGPYPVPERDAFLTASEPGTNDSLRPAQSEQCYHSPPDFSAFPSVIDNVGTPIETGVPYKSYKSRRKLSFHSDVVTRRVGSTSPSSDVQLPSAIPNKVPRALPNTADLVHVNPIPDYQQESLSAPIAPSLNDACTRIADFEEDSEAEDGNPQDEDYVVGKGLFDLNGPPVQEQQRKISKARKKHRPKVFREGRPSRPRKQKNPEEQIAKKKASEAKKMGEKPRGRKKRVTTDLKSSQGDPLEMKGGHSRPGSSNGVSVIAGCAQWQDNERVSDAERGTLSKEGLQTPLREYLSMKGPNNSLIAEIASPCAPDSSPLFTSISPSPLLSRKRDDEEDRLTVLDSSPSRRGIKRELFKEARSQRSRIVVEQALRLGEKSQESLVSQEPSMEEALVDPNTSAAEFSGAVMVLSEWNREEDISGKSVLVPTEIGSNNSPSRRLRAAARVKPLILRVTKPRSVRIPSISRSVKKQVDSIKQWDQVSSEMANMEMNENNLQLVPHVIPQAPQTPQTAIVLYKSTLQKRKSRPKVMLDEEDKRVWKLVMAQGTSFKDDNSEKEAPRQWDEERAIMKARADKFINVMHLVQGDRRFSVWKGSVVDSVVGAFLTQNVSDHLSSSAFMCLAARFPVTRKKKTAAETLQEPITEVQVEESFVQGGSGAALQVEEAVAISGKSPGTGGGSNNRCVAVFHVEEAVEILKKSSRTGGGSDICCIEQAQDGIMMEWKSCTEERLTDAKERNGFCLSKDSRSRYTGWVYNRNFHAGENLQVRRIEQQAPFISLQSGLEDVLLASSSRNHMNLISSTAAVDISVQEGPLMALPSSNGWTNSELSLVVDLGLPRHDLGTQMEEVRNTIFSNGCHSQRIQENQTNSVAGEKFCSSTLASIHGTCSSAEEVTASPGSVVPSSESIDARKFAKASAVPGSVIHCADCERNGAHTAVVIFPSHSLVNNNASEKQLVVAVDTDSQAQRGLSLSAEFPNLHSLKHIARTPSNQLVLTDFDANEKANSEIVTRTDDDQVPTAFDANEKKNSEIVTSTDDDQEKEDDQEKQDDQEKEVRGRGRGRRPVLGLTGLDRARLEELNITSKTEYNWEALRLKYKEPQQMGENPHESAHAGCKSFGSSNVENGVDWDAVRAAKVEDIANVIKERGMNNVLAGRIKAFLERVQKEHGSVDLEWLRTVPVEEAKSFLLSVRGLGLKSVECIRLLTLHHLAFPVDTNVGRIVVRLGWVPLEPLPEQLQLHLLELYPVQETIQKYLWPRLCTLDQRTLYELHYQMITFGKVFCTKSKPNCNACPMRDDCRHFASAVASARLALPAPPPKDSHATSSEPLALPSPAEFMEKVKLALPASDPTSAAGQDGAAGLSNLNSFIASQIPCEPIVEEPSTPEPPAPSCTDIEDMEQLFEEPETFFGLSSSSQTFASDKGSGTYDEVVLPPAPDIFSQALVCLPPGSESLPVPKLINAGRLRTVHYVYELPDNHPLVKDVILCSLHGLRFDVIELVLAQMDPREDDDPCFYLLAIWSPGETPPAPPLMDDTNTTGTCDGFNGGEGETVHGTLLVPCRTANRGIFPLNGTYFQVNEVFADHASSEHPIEVSRTLLWNLRRRFVYFGTSVTTIFKGLTVPEITACFWRGYICVRGYDSVSRCPKPLACRLHFPASKKTKEGKPIEEED